MSEHERLKHALEDWAERVGLEARARLRTEAGATADVLSDEYWDGVGTSAILGASLALDCLLRVDALNEAIMQRLVQETP